MNIIYLSPHFPPNYYRFCVHLRENGANVLGLADEPYDNLRPELKEALTEYYWVSDLHDYEQLQRACGYFTHRYGKIDRIDSHNEYWLETEAKLRTDFNVFGVQSREIGDIKYKSRMKKVFERAGVPVARGKLVETLEDGKSFVEKTGYPVIVKPDSGVGAANTYKLNDQKEMERFFASRPPVDYFMEEFVQGSICSFDGLTDREGRPVFFTSHQYGQGIMETVNEDRHVYYYSLRDIPEDLADAGFKTLQAFKVRERFFHFEFFRSDRDGKLVALEVNMRPPGGFTTDMFNFANDINIYKEWANVVMFNYFSAPYSRKYHCCYIGRKFSKDYVHSHEEILDRYRHLIVHHEEISGVFSPALGNYGYLIRSPYLEEIQDAVEFVHRVAGHRVVTLRDGLDTSRAAGQEFEQAGL